MKWFISVIVFFLGGMEAFAKPAIHCEMVNLVNQRIVDQGQYNLDDHSRLLLLSYGYMIGAIRDTATDQSNERRLELKFSYQLGGERGSAVGQALYNTNQAPAHLIGVTLEEPTFKTPIRLRCQLIESNEDSAGTMSLNYITGNANSSGFCTGSTAFFCVDQIKRQARDLATADASNQCRFRKGEPKSFPTCNEFCNPFSVPDDGRSHYVSCQSNCALQCEIP